MLMEKPRRVRRDAARAAVVFFVGLAILVSPALHAQSLLFTGADFEEFSGATPDHIGKFMVDGPDVVGGGLIDLDHPMNGIVAVEGILVTGNPQDNLIRRIDFDGNLIDTTATALPLICCNEDMAYDNRDPGNPVILHAHYRDVIRELDPVTLDILATHNEPDTVGVTIVDDEIWISHWSAREVGVWDPSFPPGDPNRFDARFSTPTNAGGLAYDAENEILWVGAQNGVVVPYELDGTPLNAGFQPFGAITQTVDSLEFVGTAILEAEMDIKPRSCPNPFNPGRGRGLLPVAVLGAEDFDVTQIDPDSIELEGVPPVRSAIEDVTGPVEDRQDPCECTTDGPDGYADLTLKFRRGDLFDALEPVNDCETIELVLTGNLVDGTPFTATDCVRVQIPGGGCPKP